MSKVYKIEVNQHIPVDIETAWNFFSSPSNLAKITPSELNFKILSISGSNKMYAGQIIEYHVSPLFGVPLYWMTEITQVKEHEFFIDEQRKGPYSLWHHQHHFKKVDDGVVMTDIVHYQIPLWIIGDLAHELFIKKQVREIFEYREKKIEEMFGKNYNYKTSIVHQ
jgi:ligand-binding SRPBCC domain-containing protein